MGSSPYTDQKLYLYEQIAKQLNKPSVIGQTPAQHYDQLPWDTRVAPSKTFKSGAPLPGVLPSINVPPTTQVPPDKYLINQQLLKYLGPQGGPVQ